MAPLRVFLDANALFSAALGGPGFELIWELSRRGRIRLVTSAHGRIEGAASLERKRPRSAPRLGRLLADLQARWRS